MKAVVRHRYGSLDVLQLEEIAKPTPGEDEVLINVHAASVNASDWECLRGDRLYVRLVGFGLLKPKIKILGSDIAGRVEAVGKNVKRFQPGDEIFGDILHCGAGGFAEYVCVPEDAVLVPKPAGLTFEEASAVPQAAVIALQGICDKGTVQAGQRVLINGAGGGAGTFAVQIAKLYGAEVTGVDNSGKLDMLRSIGADHVIDYEQEDFTRGGQRYDLILDLVGSHSIFDFKRALNDKGIYLMVGGSTTRLVQALALGPLLSKTGSKTLGLLAVHSNREDLAFVVKEFIEPGRVVPVIDKHYPLSEVPAALRYLGQGHARGKVVITMN